MKKVIILISAVLFLNTTYSLASQTSEENVKKDVRRQVNYVLENSEINEAGTVTVYFYVYDKSVRVQKVKGKNDDLNQSVKKCLEDTGLNRKGLNGYYTVTIKLNDYKETKSNDREKRKIQLAEN
jgi:hypothetical protein